MNGDVRIDQYPLKPNPVSADYVLIQDSEDLNVEGIRKYKKCLASAMPEVNNNVGSYTYAQLLAIATDSELTLGAWYKITNATTASFNLLVQAISTNQIGCEAKDPLYPNDKVIYNFASNTITWRWDTVNDISAGEDWRNSNNISIGTGCTRISIGIGCTVNLGANCNNIEIGNNCTVTLFAGSSEVYVSSLCGIINPANVTQNTRVFSQTATLDGNVSGIIFKAATNFTTISNKSLLYNNNGEVTNGEGDFYFIYITGGVLTTEALV